MQTTSNVFERNTVIGGEYGVLAAHTGENLFSRNVFREQVWGGFEFQLESSVVSRTPT